MFYSCLVYSSTPGIVRSGLINTTIVLQNMVSYSAGNVQQSMLDSYILFGVIFFIGLKKKKRNVL